MPAVGRNISLHVAGLVSGEGGRLISDDFAMGSHRGGESATWISNKPPDPGGGGLSTTASMRTPAWTLPPTGPRDRLWTPDEHTYPSLCREPAKQSVFPSASHQLKHRTDKQQGRAVKASAPTGSVSAMRGTGDTLPSRRQRTSKDALSTN